MISNGIFKMSLFLQIVVFLVLSNYIIDTKCQTSDVSNAKVERVIDISSQLVKINTKIVVDNSANKKSLDSYLVTFDDNHRPHLAYISASINKNTVQVNKVDEKHWRVDLSGSNAIGAGVASSPTIELEAVFTRLLEPYPTQILQSERQFVLYNGNHYFASPYSTKSQSTKVKLPPSGTLESFTKLKPSAQTDRNINLGPYENIPSNSFSELKVHYENNSPFLTVTKLERSIEISHWAGIISVEEVIDVQHNGAKLKGPFSRYDYQREPTNGISSVKSWRTKLPATARDIYYRDEIGNISTSNLKLSAVSTVAELRPRFPLFGGWKTHYVLGYYVPTQGFLFNEGNEFVLKIPFVDHIFDNSVIDDATVKIILPEGASDIKLRLPYTITRERDQTHYTYLDTIGRTVIVLHKTNLVEQHIQDVDVHYTYHKIFMLQEPLLLVLALFLLCIVVIIYVRLDFSITKNPFKQSAFKVSGIIESILVHQDKRASIYEQYDKANAKFKVT